MSISQEQIFGAMSSSSSSSSSSSGEEEGELHRSTKSSSSSSAASSAEEEEHGPPNRSDCEAEEDLDFDLYGDLESSVFHRSVDPNLKSESENLNRIKELEDKAEKYLKERVELQKQVNVLSSENKILLQNASSLLATAKQEISKKNAMLTTLQRSLEIMTRKAERSSSPHSRADLHSILEQLRKFTSVGESTTAQDIAKLVEEHKQKQTERQKYFQSGVWNKKIRLNNMSIYFKSDQIPFSRLETVTFPSRENQKKSGQTAAASLPVTNKNTQHSSPMTPDQNSKLKERPDKNSSSSSAKQNSTRLSDKEDVRDKSPRHLDNAGHNSRNNGQIRDSQNQKKIEDESARKLFGGTPSPRRRPNHTHNHNRPPHSGFLNPKNSSPPTPNRNTLHPDRARSPNRSQQSRNDSKLKRSHSPDRRQEYDRHQQKYRRRDKSGSSEHTPSPSDSRSRSGSGRNRSDSNYYSSSNRPRNESYHRHY